MDRETESVRQVENTYLAFWNLSDRSNAVTLNHSESQGQLAHMRQEATHTVTHTECRAAATVALT